MARLFPVAKDRRGNALVEFALLAPILIMLLVGMLAYGQYFLAAHTLQQLANDAARAAIVGHSEAERTTLAQASVTQGLARSAVARPETVIRSIEERDGRITVRLSVDTHALLLRSGLVPMPDKVIERRAVAELAEIA
ncbi:TadE-like protein [Sphingomonas spermidinifaciens]|uniref:TadE-like protein n=1 Tax=Sphingomonas spermidinifaciens TaxID=1141889 RepID=A0A2A4B3M5_9SPHN|nr:TadE/TadG family type IV pilus assembly protein [Sphingomonas spermidinifaciens]PCD02552.1 TadE-like protein [Sphingomonas spermidinifaciens]